MEIGREGGGGSVSSGDGRDLLKNFLLVRKRSISLFFSNLHPWISKVELEVIFCWLARSWMLILLTIFPDRVMALLLCGLDPVRRRMGQSLIQIVNHGEVGRFK